MRNVKYVNPCGFVMTITSTMFGLIMDRSESVAQGSILYESNLIPFGECLYNVGPSAGIVRRTL